MYRMALRRPSFPIWVPGVDRQAMTLLVIRVVLIHRISACSTVRIFLQGALDIGDGMEARRSVSESLHAFRADHSRCGRRRVPFSVLS